MCIYIYMNVCVYIYIYICIYIYIYMHTRSRLIACYHYYVHYHLGSRAAQSAAHVLSFRKRANSRVLPFHLYVL